MIDEQQFPGRAQAALVAFRVTIEDLSKAVAELPLHEALKFILERTGYMAMLEQENSPESLARVENLKELVNAAAEAVERGEGAVEFLDHAALVADSDALDDQAQVSLMTLHNAKGLEFPIVFLAGHGRRTVPAQPVARFAGHARRRAPALLRGDDARREAAVPELGARSAGALAEACRSARCARAFSMRFQRT